MKQEGVREGACSLEKRQEEEEKNGGLKTAANLRRTGRDRDSSCVSFQRALWIAVNSTWIDEAACSRPCSDLSLSCKQGGKEGGRGCPNQEECFIPTRRFGKSETPSILGPISSCVLIQPPRSFCTADATFLVGGRGRQVFFYLWRSRQVMELKNFFFFFFLEPNVRHFFSYFGDSLYISAKFSRGRIYERSRFLVFSWRVFALWPRTKNPSARTGGRKEKEPSRACTFKAASFLLLHWIVGEEKSGALPSFFSLFS